MNDSLKWILAVAFSMVVIVFGASALGLNWLYVQSNILSLLETIGLVLILFTGSAAAVEIGKYYRAQNRSLKDRDHDLGLTQIDDVKLRALVQQAVKNAMLELESPPRHQLVEAKNKRRSGHPDEPSIERTKEP